MHGRRGRHGHAGRDRDIRHGSRLYDVVARTAMRGLYRRIAGDISEVAVPGGRVLDVGTGPGLLLVALARVRPDLALTGVDVSPEMVAAARRNLRAWPRAEARVGNAAGLPFDDGAFDLVVSSLSVHHWGDPAAAAAELARVLAPGGRLRLYDLRPAPLDAVRTAAGELGVLDGSPAGCEEFRTHSWPIRTLSRLVMTSAAHT